MNLDRDRALERVLAEYDVGADHRYERAEIAILDQCAGRDVKHVLRPVGRSLDRDLILRSPALGRPAVVYSMTYRDRQVVRVVQLRARRAGACPAPAALFDYSTKSPPVAPPAGMLVLGANLAVQDFSSAYPGRELRLTERYARSRSGPVSSTRMTDFRYVRAKGRYVAYRTVLPG